MFSMRAAAVLPSIALSAMLLPPPSVPAIRYADELIRRRLTMLFPLTCQTNRPTYTKL